MEEKNIEQLETEPGVTTENSESSIYGKFKDAKTLLEAYNSLQSEFTRKSQKLAEIQKDLQNNAVFSNNKPDSSSTDLNSEDLEKYKKEIEEIIEKDEEISNLPNRNLIALKIIKESERKLAQTLNNQNYVDDYLNTNTELKDKIIKEYLSTLSESSTAPKVISGSASNIYFSPSIANPKTLKEAGELFSKMLK